ncbi:AIPR family protein [Chitinophaga oryzae]|uniref:AIPR family protein n=1 Tax=Chitinophaga oryzae TaxID=2725414 RepID=A0AAE6ZDY2_9BACT|nr:AIPR family protein [Chitinophaga oryzae]QJB29852.1 AIPR family protein [Chitinophaga oryzae]
MNNKILQGYLTDFKAEFNFADNVKEEELFEHFVNYCILSKVHPEAFYNDTFKIEAVNVGGGNDTGIDGVAIVVNDHIVNSIEEVDSLKNSFQRLEVRFIFTQAKTSSEFKSSEIGNFIFGVKDFFKDSHSLVINDDIQNLREIKEYIYSQSIFMDEPPLCELHFVTTGKWLNDQNVVGRVDSDIDEVKNRGLFRDITFHPVDAEHLERIYKEIKNKITKEINFEKHTPLPRIEGVKEAYIGILPAKEYISLITDSEERMQRTLFYDNVRDFLGLNPVNQEIQATLLDKEKQLKFPIFNNGITIVAKNLNKVGTYFKVKDFQVVNGCQTSNLLYNNKKHLDLTNTYIPVKLIITDNQEVINDIIKATNRQTEVKTEAFESLKEYHKKLQAFYDSFPKETKLYYERRPREYDTAFPPIPRTKIITLSAQINAVISMFFNEPHSTHRYYGELLKAYSDKLFLEDHNPYIYYVSSLCLHKVDILIKQNVIPAYFRHYKYHLITAFRILVSGFKYPKFNSKEINKYCEAIYCKLMNDNETRRIVKDAADCVTRAIGVFIKKHGERNIHDFKRLKDVTFEVIEQAKRLDPIFHKK